ncbi:hypothetical protein TVNIR_1742 [Thioalkalivibrio nitratireducens DSM 14787]|uniref:TIR domain-containing protein n=1 Tax=Thioalkalivibrio nitratireducens (strain DSM 14787 / UNIQEM 213 / ALEN2) TaxID=1255043 RepID=L0DUZ4_THIND|nr:TIR domain-containing protein [Thioalkalivibrio nitratireducens]AGA33404.1 hypothetical protein TVNIR_1742 [Thioalkalivibrio nitratireducens DSM 14787]
MKIFLAFSFRDDDKALVGFVEQLLASHHVQAITGERLAGEQLTPAVQRRIDSSDALVALLTRRDELLGGGWTTHQWVLDELAYARAHNKRAIAVVEDGVNNGGMYQPHERIALNRDQPVESLLILSETIGLWKRAVGRTVKVQLLPAMLARRLGAAGNNSRCRYRLWLRGEFTDWRESTPVPEGGGTFLYINGVDDEHLIQLEVQEYNKVWQSVATSQWMHIKLSSVGNQP